MLYLSMIWGQIQDFLGEVIARPKFKMLSFRTHLMEIPALIQHSMPSKMDVQAMKSSSFCG